MGIRHEPPNSGSHWKFFNPAGEVYPISAHNGLKEEIPYLYVRRLCRAFGLDYDELKRRL